MPHRFTLDFWIDGGWYVGKLREVPNVFSQGESLEELKANIQDAYRLMNEGTVTTHPRNPVAKLVPVEHGQDRARQAAKRIRQRRARLEGTSLSELMASIHEGHRH